MAKNYGEIAASALMTFDKSFSRSNGQPLDSTEVFYSLSDLQTYAASNVAYIGQKVVLIETSEDDVTTVTHYSIEPDNSLKELGAKVLGDGQSIEVVDGKVTIKGFSTAETGAQPRKNADGSIEWVVPDTTTVEGLQTEVAGLRSDVNTNTANITAINNTIGTVSGDTTLIELINANTSAISTLNGTGEGSVTKSVDNAINDFATKISDDGTVNTFKELVDYVATHGPEAATMAANILENSNAIDNINNKIGTVTEGKTVVEMIADAAYDDTEVRGLITTNTSDISDLKTLTALPAESYGQTTLVGYINYISSKDVASLESTINSKLDTKVDKVEGKGLSTNDFTDDLKSKLDGIAEGAQANVLEAVKVNDTLLDIVDKAVNIPVASADALGVVKSSTAENGVAVGTDGTMSVNSVNVTKLTQDDVDTLILDGGTSTARA